MGKISVVLVNTKNAFNTICPYTFDKQPTLEDFYKVLDCDCIDIVRRKIGGSYYDLIVDDEGLLKNKRPAIATFDNDQNIVETLVGNVLVVKYDDNGEKLISLSKGEIIRILCSTISAVVDNEPVELLEASL